MWDTADIETQTVVQGIVLQYRVHTPSILQYFEIYFVVSNFISSIIFCSGLALISRSCTKGSMNDVAVDGAEPLYCYLCASITVEAEKKKTV